MDAKQKMKRAGGWLVVTGVLVVLVVLVTRNVADWDGTTAEWSQAIIQVVAAVGGFWFGLYRSRPRVTLHLRIDKTLVFLDLTNVGNRVARRVKVECEPPIPLRKTLSPEQSREFFGPCEAFGDMDRGQRHAMAIGGSMGSALPNALEQTTFTVSHESTWGFWRPKSSLQFTGSGLGHVSLNKGEYPASDQMRAEIQAAKDD